MNKRLDKVHKILRDKKLDSILISSVSNISYLTNLPRFADEEREAFVLITKNKKFLITDLRYSEAIKKVVKNYDIIEDGSTYFLSHSADFFLKHNVRSLGFEEEDLRYSEYSTLKKNVKATPLSLSKIREIKDQEEIKSLKKACVVSDLAFKHIIKKLKTGISEIEICFEMEMFIKGLGYQISFYPIVAFGRNSSVPHHKSGAKKLQKNDIVLLDFGAKVNNYCSDLTRTIYFGKADNKFKEVYLTVLDAQQKAIEHLSSNRETKAEKLDGIARDYILSRGFPNIPHSLGHGVGIDVHEAPHISSHSHELIQENMAFSVEPGIYIPGWGGVRIEDIVVTSKKGTQLISHANRQIIEI